MNNKPFRYILLIPLFLLLSLNGLWSQNIIEQAKLQYYLACIEDKQLDFKEKIAYYDSICNYYNRIEDRTQGNHYCLEKIKLIYDNGDFVSAYTQAVDFLNQLNQSMEDADERTINLRNELLITTGTICFKLGMYEDSISYYFKVLQQDNNPYVIEAYSYLAMTFTLLGQLNNGKGYNMKALELLNQADDSIRIKSAFKVYNHLAGYYHTIQENDSALYYLNLTFDYVEDEDPFNAEFLRYNNMGLIYSEMGETEMAQDYFSKAIEVAPSQHRKVSAYYNMGTLFQRKNNLSEAEKYFHLAIEESKMADNPLLMALSYARLSDIYHEQRDYKKAWQYLKTGMELRDSLFSNQKMEQISQVLNQFDVYRVEMDKKLLDSNLQLEKANSYKKNIWIGMLIFLLFAISSFAILSIRKVYLRYKEKVKIKTEEKEEEVRKEYEVTLEIKNRELASKVLSMSSTDDIILQMKEKISEQIVNNDPEKVKLIAEEMNAIMSSYEPGRVWEDFRYYFEQVHQSFYQRLYEIRPNITKTDQRICALLSLNLSVKEIARITNRSARTIENAVSRLRKNLQIPSDEGTTQFFNKLLNEDVLENTDGVGVKR